MKRAIIIISESGYVNILDSNVWVSSSGLVGLFGASAPALRAASELYIKAEWQRNTHDITRQYHILIG